MASSDPTPERPYTTVTLSGRTLRIGIGNTYHEIPVMESKATLLNPVMINAIDFIMTGVVTPSPSSQAPGRPRLGLAEVKARRVKKKNADGEGHRPKPETIILQGHRFQPLSRIDISGKQCRVIPPPAPRPSGCKGVAMVDLPLDILNLIYESLKAADDNCTAVCLALTCRGFFNTYKAMNPGPIDIWTFTQYPMWAGPCPHSGQILLGVKLQWLGELLTDWIGPKYRPMRGVPSCQVTLRRPFRPYFLHVDTYGHSDTEYGAGYDQEVRLIARYQDWLKSAVRIDGARFHALPSPYGKGQKWYEEARLAMLRDAERRESWGAWTQYWLETQIYQRLPYMERLQVADSFKERKEIAKKKARVVCKLGQASRFIVRQVKHLRYRMEGKDILERVG